MELHNAQRLHEEFPDTFEIPSDQELKEIGPGDNVKIGVKIPPSTNENLHPTMRVDTERFWVEVEAVQDGVIQGKVNNDLIFTEQHGLKCDDRVTLMTENVYSIMKAVSIEIPVEIATVSANCL